MATPSVPDQPAAYPAGAAWRGAVAFAAIAAVLVAALGLFAEFNSGRIARNSQAALALQLDQLLGQVVYDNDPVTDVLQVTAPDRLGTSAPVAVHRVRRGAEPVAAVLLPTAPEGYGGPIQLMIAVDFAGKILGVEVLEHHETPGLGDVFAARGSTWLAAFTGRSLPDREGASEWAVRKDGGDFDEFTGATVSPRAIVKGVRSTLEFYQANRERLYADAQ